MMDIVARLLTTPWGAQTGITLNLAGVPGALVRRQNIFIPPPGMNER